MNTKNNLRDQIFTCIEISKRSKVPMLFISNPGYGKTTTINLYAKTYGYHVETLIGSHYSQDEILGFQANTGSNHLSILEPEWFTRIKYAKSKNVPSILFLDELSTVSPSVQGALLQLCFERKIRGGKSLPDDCIVLAAANYKQNLPGYSDIIAPELNRFCIINLLPNISNTIEVNSMEIIDEFTQDFHEVTDNLPTFATGFTFSEEQNKSFLEEARKKLKSLFQNHSYEKNTSGCLLDFRNILYDGIYDRMDSIQEVYNFISPRTISYYLRIVRTLCEMKISKNDPIIGKICEGLLGLGTNTFKGDDVASLGAQIRFFNHELNDMTYYLIQQFSTQGAKVPAAVEEKQNTDYYSVFVDNSIAGQIKNYISSHDTKAVSLNRQLTDIMNKIGKAFNTTKYEYSVKAFKANPGQFRSDFEAIKIFREILSKKLGNSYEEKVVLKSLKSIIDKFEPAYTESIAA